MSLRNIELKTTSLILADAAASTTVGDIVPTGMKRWFTFFSVRPAAPAASAVGVHLASVSTACPTEASVIATTNRKLIVRVRSTTLATSMKFNGMVNIPHDPNVHTPLFSIAGGNYCGIIASKCTAQVFTQYYDE